MEYKVIQDTRYQDRYEIWAVSQIGQTYKVAVTTKSQVKAALHQLAHPYGD